MSSSAYFPSGLNNWAASDKPQRIDFVSDNEILDQAISDLREDTESLEQEVAALHSENESMNQAIDATMAAKATVYDNTAVMENGGLVVTSQAPEGKTAYSVEVDIPDGYTAAQSFILDDTPVTVTGPDMQPTTLDAAPGAVVSLARRDSLVFPKLGGGEGADVSLRVIASTTQPANPTAGTVWVNTSMPLPHKNAYVLASAFADASLLPEGFIGLQATTVAPGTANSVNALKKGALHLVISRLYQNQGGVLQHVPGAYYTGSAWVSSVSTLVVYELGKSGNYGFSGGQITGTYGVGVSAGVNNSGISISVSGSSNAQWGGGHATSTSLIDMTLYKTLCARVGASNSIGANWGAMTLAATTSHSISGSTGSISINPASAQGHSTTGTAGTILSVNIADVIGERYITAALHSHSNLTVSYSFNKIWLEP